MTDITPDPIMNLILEYVMNTAEKTFVSSAVMEDPQPLSINELYTVYRGRLNLTSAGRRYKDGLAEVVGRSSLEWKEAHDMVYQEGKGAILMVSLFFEQLENQSWIPGATTKTGLMQEPKLIKDASNYIKIVEDGVADGCGINDCNNLKILVSKYEDKRRPRTELVYIVA